MRSLTGSGLKAYHKQIKDKCIPADIFHHDIHRISSTTPPRPREAFKRIPASVPSKTQLDIATSLHPADISLPITTPPCPESMIISDCQILTRFLYLRPSASRPDFMVIQSPTLIKQSEIRTLLQVGLIPSVLGPLGFF